MSAAAAPRTHQPLLLTCTPRLAASATIEETRDCRRAAAWGEEDSRSLLPMAWPASNSSTAAKALLHCMSAATSSASRAPLRAAAPAALALPSRPLGAAAASRGDSSAAAEGVASQAVSAKASACSTRPWPVTLAATGTEKASKQAVRAAWMGV